MFFYKNENQTEKNMMQKKWWFQTGKLRRVHFNLIYSFPQWM